MKNLILLKIKNNIEKFKERLEENFNDKDINFIDITDNTIRFSYYDEELKKTRFMTIDYDVDDDKAGFVNDDVQKTITTLAKTTLANNRGEVIDIKTDDVLYILPVIKFVNNYKDFIEDEYESKLIKAKNFLDDFILIYKIDEETFIYKFKDLEVMIDEFETLKIIKNGKNIDNQELLDIKGKEVLAEMKILQGQEIGDNRGVLLLNRDDEIYINKEAVKKYLEDSKKYKFFYNYGDLINEFKLFKIVFLICVGVPFLIFSIDSDPMNIMNIIKSVLIFVLCNLSVFMISDFLSINVDNIYDLKEEVYKNKDELYIRYKDIRNALNNFGYKEMVKDIDNIKSYSLENKEQVFGLMDSQNKLGYNQQINVETIMDILNKEKSLEV